MEVGELGNYVPNHQERIKEFRERCLVSRAKSATLPPEEMDRAPRVPLHISCVPELITVKEVRLGEDACCTAGLCDPARLLDRWPSLRECWRPIRHGNFEGKSTIARLRGLDENMWGASVASSTLGKYRDGQSCKFHSDGTHSGPGRMSTRGAHASV